MRSIWRNVKRPNFTKRTQQPLCFQSKVFRNGARDVSRQPNVGSLRQTRFRQQQGTRCLQTQWTVWRANLILFLADLADFFSDRQLVDRREAEAKEQNDATF